MKKKNCVVVMIVLVMMLLSSITCFAAHGDNTLYPGESLHMWQWIESSNSEYLLQMQTGGKLVLYSKNRGKLWESPISYLPGYNHSRPRCIMQADGNLVIYHELFPSKPDDPLLEPFDFPVWASNTENNAGARLVLQDDGNLVIYLGNTPLWATGTNI